MKTIKPEELIWVQITKNGEVVALITSTPFRDKYFLYEMKNGKPIKTKHTSSDPTELEKFVR